MIVYLSAEDMQIPEGCRSQGGQPHQLLRAETPEIVRLIVD